MAKYLNTYTETDPNSHLSKSPYQVIYTSLVRNEDAYIHYDYGVDFFDGDFEHHFELKITTAGVNGLCELWTLANLVDDYKGIVDASGDMLAVAAYHDGSNVVIQVSEVDGGTSYASTAYIATVGTSLFATVTRTEAVGSYGEIRLKLYSDAARTSLVSNEAVILHTSKKNYRYQYSGQSFNSGTAQTQSGTIQDLEFVDLWTGEDLSAYTKSDPGSDIKKLVSRLTFNALDTRNTESYTYYDWGAGYWSGDFEFDFTIYIDSSISTTFATPILVANIVDELKGIVDASGDALCCIYYNSAGTHQFVLREYDSGTAYSATIYNITLDTLYFCRMDRDETIGSYGQLRLRLWSDEVKTTLLNTQTLALHKKTDYQYSYPLNTYNSSNPGVTMTGFFDNYSMTGDIGAVSLTPFYYTQFLGEF